jgi:signal peptidase II
MLQHIRNKGFIAFATALIVLDQCTKIAIKGFSLLGWKHDGMTLYESIQVMGDAVRITYVENPGMAFGISFGAGKIFLSLFSVVASALLVWYLARLETPSFGAKLALALIFAGATGNLIDRVFYGVFYGESPLFYGKVVDFLDVDIPDIVFFGREYVRFWVFNVADSCVSVGMVFMLFFNKHLPFLQDKTAISPKTAAEQQSTPNAITTSNEAQ